MVTRDLVTALRGAFRGGNMKKARTSIVDCHSDAGTSRRLETVARIACYRSTKQVQVIVQYAPGTQVNCSGLLGLVAAL